MVSGGARGFSLLELLLALTITLGLGFIGFRLFLQNERVFRNETSRTEAEQNARAVAVQIADEIRRAGQGVPLYASAYDDARTDALAFLLNGSDATHLRIREGFSNAETSALTVPAEYTGDVAQTLSVTDSSALATALATSSPHGRFVYIWGSGSLSCWSWIRAELSAISGTTSLAVIPRQIGDECRSDANTVRLTSTQVVALEEAVSIYLNNGSIWRTTATDMTSPANPAWSSTSELARDIQSLTLTYYDANNQPITPSTLANRLSVVRIDARIQHRSGYVLDVRSFPRNARLQ